MFGIRIGGSGRLYLSVPVGFTDPLRVTAWRPFSSPAEYRLFGRRSPGRILLNDPTLPHAGTGRPTDPTRESDRLAAWREMWELRFCTCDLVLG